jgi:hypothetical protein
MLSTLITNNPDPVSVTNLPGLPLFSSKGKVPPLCTYSPQAVYSKGVIPSFEPVIAVQPVPITSKFYIIPGLYSTTLPQVSKVSFLKPESYFIDSVNSKTYLLTNSSILSLSTETILNESEFTSIQSDSDLNYFYSFVETQPFTISKITTDGLQFTLGLGAHTFSFDNQNLVIHAKVSCGPREDSRLVLSTELALSNYSPHEAFIFDLSLADIDFVDSITYQNKSYVPQLEDATGTLIYNPKERLAICF